MKCDDPEVHTDFMPVFEEMCKLRAEVEQLKAIVNDLKERLVSGAARAGHHLHPLASVQKRQVRRVRWDGNERNEEE